MLQKLSDRLESNTSKLLDTNFSEDENILITKSYVLRRWIGILGVSLPVLLYLNILIQDHVPYPLPSISHYYFTKAGSIFSVILSLLAVFLIIYKGKFWDFILSSIAGIAALFVVLFPTDALIDACCIKMNCVITTLEPNSARQVIHFISAGVFLISLALMSIFVFTRPHETEPGKVSRKPLRNRIYQVCGYAMIFFVILIVLGHNELFLKGYYEKFHLTFWLEAFAIWSFGVSWFIKGHTIFKDKDIKA